jgi:hypothetical protein
MARRRSRAASAGPSYRLPRHHGADAGVGQQLDQDGVRHAPVDDVRAADAAIDRVGAGAQLGIIPR